ncbi:MAG: DUF222 domain-containing protein [Nocardioides sp.]
MFPSGVLPDSAEECVEELAEVERLKGMLAARQARLTAQLAGLVPGASERSVGGQVGFARHEPPQRGRRLLTLARALVVDHPEVLGLLETGVINERRAELITHETATLSSALRRVVDLSIAAEIGEGGLCWGDRALVDQTRRIVQRLDPEGAVQRSQAARARRRVSSRVFGDGTGQVCGVVADYHLAAIMTSLSERAELLRVMGDDRTRAQIVADLYVERLTGQTMADAVPVALHLVVPAETLLGEGVEPGEIPGLGPIPAGVVRKLAFAAPEQGSTVRRLFADTTHLVAMESVARRFTGLLRSFITLRDGRCRTPWCDAPIRHTDHVTPARHRPHHGGDTSSHNGQGLCENCNYLKEEPGWHATVTNTDVIEPHRIQITTPTGQRYQSEPRPPPGANPRDHFIQTRPGVWTLIA